jgi:hypothetical protein
MYRIFLNIFSLKKIFKQKAISKSKLIKIYLKKDFMDKSEEPSLWLGINENLKSYEFLSYNLFSIRISSTRVLCANNSFRP